MRADMLLWIVAGSGWVLAIVALVMIRGQARRLTMLTEMYWQLKYDHGELKARVLPREPAPPAAQESFVPLADVRKTRT